MGDFLKETIVGPIARRVGTLAGGYFLSLGVNQHDSSTIAAGIVCACLVAFDLIMAYKSGHKVKP